MHVMISALCLLMPITANAAMPCPPRASVLQQGRDLLSKAAFYDDIKLLNAKDFSAKVDLSEAEVKRRFSGTGVFVCENAWGNGQVVGNRRTVATVFHTFLKDKTNCDKPRALNRCAFVFNQGAKRTLVYAKKVVASGGCGRGSKLAAGNDWALVELERPLPDVIKPYEVPESEELPNGQQVTIVGRTTGFNPDAIEGDLIALPQAYASCAILGRSAFNFAGEVQSNCPTADGSSGSGILRAGPNPTLAGLVTGDIPTEEVCVPREGSIKGDGPFEMNCRGSLIVPASGRFLEALQKLK